MSGSEWQKVKAIFNSAVELSPENRAAYLADACGANDVLRKEVEKLLDSYRSDFMEVPAGKDTGNGRLTPGTTVGRYEIVDLLAVGGMGKVYLASDTQLDRKVAIKVLNEKYKSHESNILRFIREAKAASALNHPNILVIHEIGESADSHYIVSEYVNGKTLREILNERKLSVSETLDITIQVASALAAAHAARIVHRDIKPENVVVRADGYVKVLDFGLAKLIPSQRSFVGVEDEAVKQNKTAEGLILGTVSYMSPEQAKGESVDERTDIFSLGVVIYEMLAGSTPFAANSTSERFANLINKEPDPLSWFAPGVSEELESIVLKALRKDRNHRYQSMNDLLSDLKGGQAEVGRAQSVSGNQQNTIRLEPRPTEQAPRRYGRIAVRSAILIAGLLIVTGAAVVANWYRTSNVPQNPASFPNRSAAYDLYMHGKVKVGSENPEEVESAIKLLEQAVAIDPNYAEAYATLARAYNTKTFQFASESEKKQLNENAEVAVEKALALDPNLAEGHFARGLILWTHAKRFPHEQAIQSLKRAIDLDPNMDEAHHQLSMIYAHIGLLDEAQKEVRKAVEINPNNTMARFRIGVYKAYQGKFDDAVAVFKTVPRDVSPSLVNRNVADALVHLGRLDEASRMVEEYLSTHSEDPGGNVTSVKAVLLAKTGKKEEAEATIKRAIEIGQGFGHFHHTAYNIASAYAIMNNPTEALQWLQNAADDGFPCYPYFEIDPNLDNIRRDPSFVQFMEKGKIQMEKFRASIS